MDKDKIIADNFTMVIDALKKGDIKVKPKEGKQNEHKDNQ